MNVYFALAKRKELVKMGVKWITIKLLSFIKEVKT